MRIKGEIKAIILLIILAIILYQTTTFWKENSERANIKKYILEDLRTKHPTADIVGILSITKKKNSQDKEYYFIKTKVVEDYYTPCPVRIHYYYNYPEQNFITQPPEYITKQCKVCSSKLCVIAFE